MEDTKQLENLLARTALNDRAAFEQLYGLTSPRLFGFAMQMLKKKELAEEVIQDAFVKIWYNANQYHHERGAPLAWMTGIVRYKAIDLIRTQKNVLDFDNINEIELSLPASNDRHVIESNIVECMEELQENQKKSVLLAFYEGYTHQELSVKLSVPLGTMKSWIRRGLDKLKSCLDGLR